MDVLLQLENIHTHIQGLHILQGIDLLVPNQGCTVLLGRNGAGKTTTLRTILGFTPKSQGEIFFMGQAISSLPPYDIAKRRIGYVPEERGIFHGLSVEENLRVAARDGEQEMRERLPWVFQLFPDLKDARSKRAGSLSGGQQQMLAISRVLVSKNLLLLIDEPSSGLAPIVVEKVAKVLYELKKEVPILMVEQNYEMARSISDRYAIIESGRTVHRGSLEELEANQDVKRKYLGVSA